MLDSQTSSRLNTPIVPYLPYTILANLKFHPNPYN
jgi:hypothetical protein